jgi:hypothetical protein
MRKKKERRPPPAVPPGSKFISASQLRKYRYGDRSHMWLVRLLANDPTFPRPVYFGRLRFFEVAALEEYERSRVVAGQPTKRQVAS